MSVTGQQISVEPKPPLDRKIQTNVLIWRLFIGHRTCIYACIAKAQVNASGHGSSCVTAAAQINMRVYFVRDVRVKKRV